MTTTTAKTHLEDSFAGSHLVSPRNERCWIAWFDTFRSLCAANKLLRRLIVRFGHPIEYFYHLLKPFPCFFFGQRQCGSLDGAFVTDSFFCTDCLFLALLCSQISGEISS